MGFGFKISVIRNFLADKKKIINIGYVADSAAFQNNGGVKTFLFQIFNPKRFDNWGNLFFFAQIY